MAVSVDSSSPVRFSGLTINGGTITSASFTAPTNSLIVVCLESDGDIFYGTVTNAVTDSGSLTWSKQVERTTDEATDGGTSAIWTATQVTSAARTVTITHNHSLQTGTTRRVTAKTYVLTGVDISGTPVDTVTASNEDGSTTNNLTTTSITPGATGLLIAADCDWSAGGDNPFEAGDLTQDTTYWAGAISVCDGHKGCTSGVGVTANLNAGGSAAAQHKWCQIIVRGSVGGGITPGTIHPTVTL